jgi:hypothetical protein
MPGQIIAWGSPAARPEYYTPPNTSGATVQAGQLVSKDGPGTGIVLADADALATACIGLVESAIGAGGSGVVRVDGTLELADWTAATGAAALVSGSTYYLSATAGQMTTVAPTAIGQVVQAIGTALSATTLSIEIEHPILL